MHVDVAGSGVPMPRLSANRAAPPLKASPLWPITISAAARGAAARRSTGAAGTGAAGVGKDVFEDKTLVDALCLEINFHTLEKTERDRINIDVHAIGFQHTVELIRLFYKGHAIGHSAATTTGYENTDAIDVIFLLGDGDKLFDRFW